MAIVINGSAIQIVGGAIALDTDLCCDDLCPVPACFWTANWSTNPSQLPPLASSYSLTFDVFLAKGSPDGTCAGNPHSGLTGEWACSDSVSLLLEPVVTRCRYEDDGSNTELCPGNSDLDDPPASLPTNWTLIYGGTYLKYLPVTDEWEIGFTLKAGSQDLAVAATASADSLHRPPSGTGVWSFELLSNTFDDGECHVYGSDSTPSYDEIMITDFGI